MVDQLPFMVSAINLDVTQGGVDEESDERFRRGYILLLKVLVLLVRMVRIFTMQNLIVL